MTGHVAHSGVDARWFAARKPLLLVLCLILAGVLALSVHVILLAAGVPFPLPQPPVWARWLHLSLVTGGALALLKLSSPNMDLISPTKQMLILFALLTMIQETLRAAIMPAVITGGWLHSAAQLANPLLRTLILASLCVVVVRWVRGGWSWTVFSLLTGAAGLALTFFARQILAPLLSYAERFARPELYQFPYPFHITLTAYVTFIEAVAGATLVAMLAWDRLPGSLFQRLISMAVLVALLKGVVGGFFVYGFFTGISPLVGLWSWSQFLLEFLALGFLTGLAWHKFGQMVGVAEA